MEPRKCEHASARGDEADSRRNAEIWGQGLHINGVISHPLSVTHTHKLSMLDDAGAARGQITLRYGSAYVLPYKHIEAVLQSDP